MPLQVTTNWHSRELVEYVKLPDAARKEFTYIESEDEAYQPRFFRYRNSWYDALDFPTYGHPFNSVPEELRDAGWIGFQSDTFFSGIAIRWGKDWSGETDYESVIVGNVYAAD